MLFVAVGQGQILTYFQKRGMSTINARRIAQTVSMAGPGTGLLLSLAFKDNKWGAYVSVTLATACIGAMQVSLSLSLSLSLRLKGLFLYTGGVFFHAEWCLKQL